MSAATESADVEILPTELGVEGTPEPELTPLEPQADVTNEPLLTEVPVVEATPQPTEEPVLPTDENSSEEPIIVADGTGDPLVLGSTETEELLQGGDPWFMVGTQKYAWVFDPDGAGGASW